LFHPLLLLLLLLQLTDPFLNVFRGIIPAIGGIDLSPMLGFFLLNFVRNLLMQYSHVM
jgi:YggT family protein